VAPPARESPIGEPVPPPVHGHADRDRRVGTPHGTGEPSDGSNAPGPRQSPDCRRRGRGIRSVMVATRRERVQEARRSHGEFVVAICGQWLVTAGEACVASLACRLPLRGRTSRAISGVPLPVVLRVLGPLSPDCGQPCGDRCWRGGTPSRRRARDSRRPRRAGGSTRRVG
jgi:hypothetical protein